MSHFVFVVLLHSVQWNARLFFLIMSGSALFLSVSTGVLFLLFLTSWVGLPLLFSCFLGLFVGPYMLLVLSVFVCHGGCVCPCGAGGCLWVYGF